MQDNISSKRLKSGQKGFGNHAIIVAAGNAQRFGGDVSKQFRHLIDKPVYRWSLDVFLQCPDIHSVVLALPAAEIDRVRTELAGLSPVLQEKLHLVSGGKTRKETVENALASLPVGEESKVLIHDAARPGLTPAMVVRLLNECAPGLAVAPALPVNDALRRETGETIDRFGLQRIQTPQALDLAEYRQALAAWSGREAVDDMTIAVHSGAKARLIPGDERLLKLTYPEDLNMLEKLLLEPQMETRTGFGFDVHAFEPGDHVWLCGERIAHSRGLKGHSDADVAWHALTDAILGALGDGDIGVHFPPTDPTWSGAPSASFIKHAAQRVSERAGRIIHTDITIICEAPKIGPIREKLRRNTAAVLDLSIDRISVKATTTEGLGFAGRREGIAAQAIASITLPSNELG